MWGTARRLEITLDGFGRGPTDLILARKTKYSKKTELLVIIS
jgi:hypothetical protein